MSMRHSVALLMETKIEEILALLGTMARRSFCDTNR